MHLHFLLHKKFKEGNDRQGEATDPGRLGRRNAMLDEIHFREKQLDRLNYLRYEIQKKNSSRY